MHNYKLLKQEEPEMKLTLSFTVIFKGMSSGGIAALVTFSTLTALTVVAFIIVRKGRQKASKQELSRKWLRLERY